MGRVGLLGFSNGVDRTTLNLPHMLEVIDVGGFIRSDTSSMVMEIDWKKVYLDFPIGKKLPDGGFVNGYVQDGKLIVFYEPEHWAWVHVNTGPSIQVPFFPRRIEFIPIDDEYRRKKDDRR